MNLVKKSVGEKNRKGSYENWSFQINGVEVARLSKGTAGESRGKSMLITHYRIAYCFEWITSGLQSVFGVSFSARGSSSFSMKAPDLWNDYDAYYPATKHSVTEAINRALVEKGLAERVE